MNRPYDSGGKYIKAFLKEYKFWGLEVSYRQHTLGSAVVLLKRSLRDFSKLTDEELLELKKVIVDLESALSKNQLFRPDLMNYLQLGNNKRWLHIHCVPRYEKPRMYEGKEWVDTNFGLPVVWNYEDVTDSLVENLVEEIKPYLPHD